MSSKKPCPGCGQVVVGRKEKELCYDCRELMKYGKMYRTEHFSPEKNKEWIRVPKYWYRLPSCGTDELMMSIHELILSIGDQLSDVYVNEANIPHKEYSGHCSGNYDVFISVPAGVKDKLINLFEQIRINSLEKYNEGYKQGKSLLYGLAVGDISVSDFFRRA